jgi:hypothetical protein
MPVEESFKAVINIFRKQKKDPCHTAIPDASPEVTINPPILHNRRKIRLIEGNAKCLYLRKIDLQRDCVAGVYLSEDASPPRF